MGSDETEQKKGGKKIGGQRPENNKATFKAVVGESRSVITKGFYIDVK